MADHGSGGNEGEVVDRPEDQGGPMEVEIGDQQPVETVLGIGAVVAGSDDGDQSHVQEVGGDDEHRATEEAGATGSVVRPLDPSVTVEGSVVIGGDSGVAGGSGADGDDMGPSGFTPRDLVRGKGVTAEEEEAPGVPFMYREKDVLFRPAATSSSHRPIMKQDVTELLSDEQLAQLLEDNPAIGAAVLEAQKERERVIAASEAATRAERERAEEEEALRGMEAEERAGARVYGPKVTAVIEAESLTRVPFTAEEYMPPTPHLFMPSGFAVYRPQRMEYDPKLILRDPETHILSS
ncbi:uncharacterized protein LOC131326078 [Rhododendron vialii]|uniref:uncharacterized protein LOC131326078 n=1 Tax=Rhododendron vialii TaxID=182163 RepID=UPI00265FB2BE|nr:uncharacterized protein LOC131326078 [Rhododendron vialii]